MRKRKYTDRALKYGFNIHFMISNTNSIEIHVQSCFHNQKLLLLLLLLLFCRTYESGGAHTCVYARTYDIGVYNTRSCMYVCVCDLFVVSDT